MVFIYHPNVGAVRMEQFKGTAQDLTDFGVTRYDENGGAGRKYFLGPREVFVDSVLIKTAVWDWTAAGVVIEQPGAVWRFYEGGLGGIREAFTLKDNARDPSPAGGNMKTPNGHTIRISGNAVTQPGSGQPARDQWTGALTGGTVP